MRVLLSGGSGFIGGHTAHALAERGHDLRLLLRRTSDVTRLTDLDYEPVYGDLTQPESLAPACDGVDAVVHTAAVLRSADDRAFMRANADGSRALAESAAAGGVSHFVYVSSIAAQGSARQGVAESPEGPLHPQSIYGESKAEGEHAVREAAARTGMSVRIVRPPLVYGPGDTGLLGFFQMASYGFALRLGDGSNRTDAIYGPDLAEALVSLLDCPPVPGTAVPYHVADDGGAYDWNQLFAALGGAFRRRLRILPTPVAAFELAARGCEWYAKLRGGEPMIDRPRVIEMRQPAWLCDDRTLREASGWHPRTSLDDGVAATLEWYRRQGWVRSG